MKLTKSCLLVLPFLLMGCDPDEDGLSSADEKAAGTDPAVADTDGDGLNDFDEVNGDTDPLVADTDGDGLSDGDEVAAGTNPILADSDADGFSDGDEATADSDPLNQFSFPFGGEQWPDFSANAAGMTADTWAVGSMMPDFELEDQHGNMISLHQFYGYSVLLDFSAGWCGPCKSVASDANALWSDYREDGFIIIHIMIDGWSGGSGADNTFLNEWADEYGLEFPVTMDADNGAKDALGAAGLYEGYIPFMVLLDTELKIDGTYTGGGTEADIEARVAELLGVDVVAE